MAGEGGRGGRRSHVQAAQVHSKAPRPTTGSDFLHYCQEQRKQGCIHLHKQRTAKVTKLIYFSKLWTAVNPIPFLKKKKMQFVHKHK